jgi:hypothetical protein
LDGAWQRSYILEKTNGPNSSGAAGKTLGGVFEGDSTDGEDWNFDRAADHCKTVEPLRRPKLGF